MDLVPHINDPVVLRDLAGGEHRSRVEDVGPGQLTVARPLDLPADHDHAPGVAMQVTWAAARGIAVLPVRLVEAHSEGTLPLWSLAVTGEGWVEQRRRFVRVPASGPVTLRPRADGPEVETVTGHLLDVSEAAVRCAVDAATTDVLAEQVEVTAGFRFGDREFAIPARIEYVRPSPHQAELAELVVIFDEPVAEADALRKQVYDQQLRTLRARDGR